MAALIEIYANIAQTTLQAGIGPSATSLTLLSGTGSLFPQPTVGQNFFRMTLNDTLTGEVYEVVYCTQRVGDVCTVIRAQEGTTGVSWVAGDKVYEAPSAGAMANLAQQAQVQLNLFNYAQDNGSANAYSVTLTPNNLSTPVASALVYFLAAHANTGASTITVNGGGTYPILGQARVPLQGGEISTFTAVAFDAALASYVLLWSTGGSPQVPTASATNQAVGFGQADTRYAKLAGSISQPFSASTLTANTLTTAGATVLTLISNTSAAFQNVAGNALIPVSGGKGAVGSTSTQFVTGAQLQAVYKVGEVKMWHGAIASIATVWGPGWQLANGSNGTANLLDRMPIAAGNLYAVSNIGGSSVSAISVGNMPSHNHAIGDPGHAHGVGDPGHAHGVADPGHAHGPAVGGNFWIDNGAGQYDLQITGPGTDGTLNNTAPSGTGIGIYASGTGIFIGGALTGVFTGFNGSGAAFATISPYYALAFIEYTGIGA